MATYSSVAADPKTASAAFSGLCTTNYTANDVLTCQQITASIFYNIRVAQKGGMLCQALGACTPDLAVNGTTCNMTVNGTSGRLNLCGRTGVEPVTSTAAGEYKHTFS